MANNVKIQPGQPKRFFVGIDVTQSLDTVAWGDLWNKKFGWSNFLWELDLDPTDNQRRVDKAHPTLPIRRLIRSLGKNNFADTCILPQGVDAKGTDKLWPGATGIFELEKACKFMQTFILSPGADKSTSSLNDTGTGVTADVIYLSSHGFSTGSMIGDKFGFIFEPSRAAERGAQFSGAKWLLLSNCNTLRPSTQGDWLKLMTGVNPLRGVVGFQDTCPLAPGSVSIFAGLINRLEQGKTFIEAWADSLTAHGLEDAWVVLCHDDAHTDRIRDLNGTPNLILQIPAPKISIFNKTNPSGAAVTVPSDPFETFWSKGGNPITAANRSDSANLLTVGDTVSITVKPPAGTANFTAGTKISLTLIYVRTDYEHFIVDITKMFSVASNPGASGFTVDHLNPDTPGPVNARTPDSWILTVTGAPTEVRLDLKCLDLNGTHSGYDLKLRADIGTAHHDFDRNGTILVR